MNLLTYIASNWDSLLIATTLIAGIIFALVKGQKQILQQLLFTFVTEAEKLYGSGTGALKKAQVITWVYEKLPAWLRPFMTESRLTKWTENALELAKKKWTTNEKLQNYIAAE